MKIKSFSITVHEVKDKNGKPLENGFPGQDTLEEMVENANVQVFYLFCALRKIKAFNHE